MRVAVIDLGTNAVRFDVHDIEANGTVRRLHRERLAVRLGEQVFLRGRIAGPAIHRTLAAFQSFQKTSRDLRVEKILAFGTSALREASNSQRVLDSLRKKTGIEVQVISGMEEARLIAQGVLSNGRDGGDRSALVDIGGGSVEIILCRGRRVLWSGSFKLGAARLHQVFLKKHGPGKRERGAALKKMGQHALGVLSEGAPRGGWPKVDRIIGSAGTIRALERLHRENGGKRFTPKDAAHWAERLGKLPPHGLLKIAGMERKRIETIVPGAVVLAEVSKLLRPEMIETTEYSLRDGMLEEEIRARRRSGRSGEGGWWAHVRAAAKRWHRPDTETQNVGLLAHALFDRLALLHRLKANWRTYLAAAATLQDVGEIIGPVHHERHSAYMIRSGDIPGLAAWEVDFLAALVYWHKSGKPNAKDGPLPEKSKRRAFLKLTALLRLVDALKKPIHQPVSLLEVTRSRQEIRLTLRGRKSAVELVKLRLEQKKDLFEKIFKVALRV